MTTEGQQVFDETKKKVLCCSVDRQGNQLITNTAAACGLLKKRYSLKRSYGGTISPSHPAGIIDLTLASF